MDYYYDINDHDEDDLPEISLPTSNHSRLHSNHHRDEQDDQHSNTSLNNWRNLYETSVQSLRSDEDEQRSSPVKPFYLEPRASSPEQPPSPIHENHILQHQRSESPIVEIKPETGKPKSKWEIRLPELLDGTVGPERQKRDVSRRHTTNVVFQQSLEQNSSSLQPPVNQPIPPLVQKLKAKFDSMSARTSPTTSGTSSPSAESKKNRFHIPKYQRLSSLNGRALTTERPAHRSRPALPIRPNPEITSIKSRSDSIDSAHLPLTTTTSSTNQRNKAGPPVSYPKHYYPPPSTTSVVKQLINHSATLVYDSSSAQKSSIKPKPLIKSATINLEQTREELINTNVDLTGRQLLPEHRKKKKNGNATSDKSRIDRSQSVDPFSNQ